MRRICTGGLRNLFPVSSFLSPFCPPCSIMAPSTLGPFVSLIRRHIGHRFPELRKMVSLGRSRLFSFLLAYQERNTLKQGKVSAWHPSRVTDWPLSSLARDRCAVCSRVSGRVSLSPPLPSGLCKTSEWRKHLTDHQRRLVALIHLFALI